MTTFYLVEKNLVVSHILNIPDIELNQVLRKLFLFTSGHSIVTSLQLKLTHADNFNTYIRKLDLILLVP